MRGWTKKVVIRVPDENLRFPEMILLDSLEQTSAKEPARLDARYKIVFNLPLSPACPGGVVGAS